MEHTLGPGSIVTLHLVNPSEKYWGLLHSLEAAGIVLRGVNLTIYEDWIQTLAHEDDPDLGPSTVFFPMSRVERMFLDEPVGEVESLVERFENRVGASVHQYLGSIPPTGIRA